MQATRILGVVGILVLVLSSNAWAIKEPETGQRFPDQVTCEGKPARAAGVGVREATFGVDVYAVVVYMSEEAKGASVRGTDACVMIRARFVRDVGLDKIQEAWHQSFKRQGLSTSDPAVKKFLSVITAEMKENREMLMVTHGDKVRHKFMGKSVTVTGSKKLADAIKGTYLGGGSPTPNLIKDLKKRGYARP